MSHIIKDRILETCSGSGTASISLTGSMTGFATFASVCVNGDTFDYFIEATDTNGALTGAWETGVGTYVGGNNSIARTTVKGSSNNNLAVNFPSFIGRVGVTQGADWQQTLNLPTNQVSLVSTRKIGAPSVGINQQEINELSWSAGTLSGFNFTDNGNGSVTISSGVATIRTSDSSYSQLITAEIAGATVTLQDNALNFICVHYNAGNPTLVTTVNQEIINERDYALVFGVYREAVLLHRVDFRGQSLDTNRNMRALFFNFSRFIHASNGSVLGFNGLAPTLSAGRFYVMTTALPHPAFDLSVAGTANENIATGWFRDGFGGWIKTENVKVISTTTYDGNAGGFSPLTNNKYGVTWAFVVHNTPSEFHFVKGQEQYNTLADAQAAKIPAQLPGILTTMGSVVGVYIYKKGVTVFDDVRSAFNTTLTSATPSTHNALSGIQGGTFNEYNHLTTAEYTGTGTGNFVRQSAPTVNNSLTVANGTNFGAVRTLQVQTNTATPTTLTTDGLAVSGTNQVALVNNSLAGFRGQVVAQNIANISDSKVWDFKGAIRRDGGGASTVIVGSPVQDIIASDGSTWSISFSADTTNGALSVNATGEAGKTIKWFCTVNMTNVVL